VVAGLESICERLETSASIAIVHHPFWWPVASQLSNTGVVYDCIDHHSGFSNASTRVLELEASLIAGADLVVATSERLWARHAASARRSVVIRNGTDFDHFAAVAGAADGRGPRPVVGYYGAIAEWFDAELVASVAAALPDCDFVLIGATAGADVSALRTAKNVRLIGEIPYRDLPAYAASFDVCMIPFRINDLTLNTNPVKVYEYLSMGKPVVSVRLPELALLSAHVRIADTADDFCRHIRESLAENSTAAIEHRREFARQHTWAARVDQFEAEVAPLFPLMSVIVLTHNGLEFTKACLTSLDQFSSYPHWELILVDNASSDGTAAYLEDFVRSRPYARVVSHAENLGFAAGNNAGARAARGEYLVFLNNDTYVTRGWLGDLRRHFEVRPELGILNPVTNNIGNEARIDIVYRDMTEMAREAASFTTARRGRTIALDVCAFFCVMIPRRVWDDVGELDEQFGLGFFEDDDYAQRLKRKGYALACAEDVFVHHHLSASFDALGAEHKRRQFERNRALFEAKWGSWDPHRYRQPSPAIAAGRTGGAEHR
jgi:GT2 family glycosyltransferase